MPTKTAGGNGARQRSKVRGDLAGTAGEVELGEIKGTSSTGDMRVLVSRRSADGRVVLRVQPTDKTQRTRVKVILTPASIARIAAMVAR